MATTYKKNAQNVYKVPLYAQFWAWWGLVLGLAVLLLGLGQFVKFEIVRFGQFGLWSLVALMTTWRAYSIAKQWIKAGTLGRLITQCRAEKAVTKNLLATMTVNRLQDTPWISVPGVAVSDKRPSYLQVQIEKLAGMYDLDKLTEDVTASFRGRLGGYAVTSAMITTDGLCYKFLLEDVATDKTWRPATLEEMIQPDHVLTLQDGLSINLADKPGLIIWGKSGSGKSTLLHSCWISAMTWRTAQGEPAEVYILDPKNEFSAISDWYPADRLAVEVDEVLTMLRHVCQKIKHRQELVREGVKIHQKFGLRAYDLGMPALVVMADEIGSLVASMDSKQKREFLGYVTQIVQKGRSVSCFAIFGTQSPKAETVLPTDIRNQFATKILLGSHSPETSRMAFDGEVATKGNVERFKGYYTSDGLTDQPMLFAVPDLRTHGLNDLAVIRKAYELGQECVRQPS